jgi:hypothetical protein
MTPLRRFAAFSLVPLLSVASCTHVAAPVDGAKATSVQRSGSAEAATAPSTGQDFLAPATVPAVSKDAVALIRDEGMNRSQVMQTLEYLTDVIGPRLTGSPNLRRANEWTRGKLSSWGLDNAHLEAWGPFGRGWSLKRFSAQVVEPYTIPLIAYPKAWSPGFDKPLVAPVVYVSATTESELAKYRGKVKGAIVLATPPREVQARFEPLAVRQTDSDLLKLANAEAGSSAPPGLARAATAAERRAQFGLGPLERAATRPITTQPTTAAAATTGPATNRVNPLEMSPARRLAFARRLMTFLSDEGAALIVSPSTQGDGGTLFVAQATVPEPATRPTSRRGASATTAPTSQPWSKDAPKVPPQMTMAIEHYNRLVRMLEQGEKLKMEVDLRVQFHDDDPMNYITVAEIPGTDLKDQIVMLGAHMDSWHSGTGATDNGAGCAAIMEAVRILKATGLRPRRTIRIALWTGEEEGLLGSKAYVEKHFGKLEDVPTTTRPTTAAVASAAPGSRPTTRTTSRPAKRLVKGPEYDALSVYFNLDNGTGKIRGVYMQGNEGVRPYFRRWLAPFVEEGAQTLTLRNTGGTDHLPFDAIGLPGFQFIQDPIEYWSRTHHSNQDVYERAQADDLKQAATILATFAYQAASLDERMPRKAVPGVSE